MRILCLCYGLLLATPALAQKAPKLPPTLLGRWKTSQVGFSVTAATPDSVRDQLDNPEVAGLNQAIFTGEARLEVEFRADSTYEFTIVRNGETIRAETGTFALRGNQLLANAPTSPDGSSFHDQRVLLLARRTLTLTFPAGPELPGATEEVQYRRVGPYPEGK